MQREAAQVGQEVRLDDRVDESEAAGLLAEEPEEAGELRDVDAVVVFVQRPDDQDVEGRVVDAVDAFRRELRVSLHDREEHFGDEQPDVSQSLDHLG